MSHRSLVLDQMVTGGAAWVDSVNGDDATGAAGFLDRPFLTIQAAVNACVAGQTVVVLPGTYVGATNAQLTMKNGVSVVGLDRRNTILHRKVTNVGTPAQAILMAENMALYNLTIHVEVTAGAVAMQMITMPGTTNITSVVRGCRIFDTGTFLNGINITATGVAGDGVYAVEDCLIETSLIGIICSGAASLTRVRTTYAEGGWGFQSQGGATLEVEQSRGKGSIAGLNVASGATIRTDLGTVSEAPQPYAVPAGATLSRLGSSVGMTKYLSMSLDFNADYNNMRTRSIGGAGSHRFTFKIPPDFNQIVEFYIPTYPTGGAAAAGRDIDLTVNFGGPDESVTQHTASDVTTLYDLSAHANKLYRLNIAPLFPGIAARDEGGVFVDHKGINGTNHYTPIVLIYR